MTRFLRTLALLLAVLVMGAQGAAAQQAPVYTTVYRPADVTYRVLQSPHFDVIYQVGAEPEARQTAFLLERSLPQTRELVGLRPGQRIHMPVVLNAFNDRSNGFLRTLPFKQEIERTGIKGNILTPRFSSWLHVVAPHELTHAAHAEIDVPVGIGWVVRRLAPDWARGLNLLAPPGINEGVAVYRESQLEEGAGRLNMPLFTMRFRAAMGSEDPWSLAQMLERPRYDRPFNRYYIGGAHLFSYLMEEEGPAFFHRATRLHNRLPYLGYGLALWHATGERPDQLGSEFRRSIREREAARLADLGALSNPEIIASARGTEYRRPRWLDDETLVVYASGYALRPGFYRVKAESGAREAISYQSISEDYYYSLSPDSSALYHTRYVRDPFVEIQRLADLQRVDLQTGRAERLSHALRAHAPVRAPAGTLWAFQNEGPFNQWIQVDADGTTTQLTDFRRALFREAAPSPADEREVAVLMNVQGRQGIFRARLQPDGEPELEPWLSFEDATIYDLSWGPEGRYLLFSADPEDVTNIYAYDCQRDRLLQLTNVPYGALEPSLSPDGQTIAFVNYQHERFDLVQMPFSPETARELASAAAQSMFPSWQEQLNEQAGLQGSDTLRADTKAYRPLRHLSPRMVYPTGRYTYQDSWRESYLGPGVGLAMEGVDPLQQWAYRAEGYYQARRIWGGLTVETSRYLLRPSLTLYNRPYTTTVAVETEDQETELRRVGVDEQGATIGGRLPYVLESNVFQTSGSVSLRGSLRRTRFMDEAGTALTDFTNRMTLFPSAVIGYRLQANPRDLVPNTGYVVSAAGSVDVWSDDQPATRALRAELYGYLPWLSSVNGGLRLGLGLMSRNRGVFDANGFAPRGYEGAGLRAGSHLRFDLEYTQALWYIEDGFLLVPLYFKALYVHCFGQSLQSLTHDAPSRSSFGAGLGLQARFFYQIDFDLRIGIAYLPERQEWAWALR